MKSKKIEQKSRLPFFIITAVLIISLFFVTKISQQNQDNRSSAALPGIGEICDGVGSECIDTGNIKKSNGEFCRLSNGAAGKIITDKCGGNNYIRCCAKPKVGEECLSTGVCVNTGTVKSTGESCKLPSGTTGTIKTGACAGNNFIRCCVLQTDTTSSSSIKYINFTLTFYTSLPRENGGYTEMANGDPIATAKNVVASNYYKLGTKIHLEGYGDRTVSDRGGSSFDSSTRLDVLIPRNSGESDNHYYDRVNAMGRKTVKGYIK